MTSIRRHLKATRAMMAGVDRNSLILLAIILIALALRLQYVRQPLVDAFSWREASTAMMADNYYQTSWNIFYPEVNWTGPGPSYQGRELPVLSYISAILFYFLGWQDWYGRAVAVSFSIVTIIALHGLVCEVWNRRHAQAAALIYAVLPGPIMIDSSFLPDPVMLALVTLGIWLFVRYDMGRGGYGLLVVAGGIFTLGVLAKLPGIGAGLVVVFVVLTWVLHGQARRVVPVLGVMALSLVLIIAYYAWAVHLGRSYPPYHVAGSGYIWDSGLSKFWQEAFYLKSFWNIVRWWYYGIVPIGLFALGLWMGPPADAPVRLRFVPYVWLAAFGVLYAVAAREVTGNPWNLHFLNVPFAIFAARGSLVLLSLGGHRVEGWQFAARAIVLLGSVLILSTQPLLKSMKKPIALSAKQLGEALREVSVPGDLVVAISPDLGDPVAIYYSRRRGWVLPAGGGQVAWSIFHDSDAEAIAEITQMQDEGAKFFGYSKYATDKKGRRFVQHHRGFLEWMDLAHQRIADNGNYAIYRLKSRQGS